MSVALFQAADLEIIQRRLAGIGAGGCPDHAIAGMVNAAFWLGVQPFEDRSLRPVFRWASFAGTSDGAARLATPVALEQFDDVRRIISAWNAPKKLLVRLGSDGPEVHALAMDGGLWAGTHPSVVVESMSPGVVLISSAGRTVGCLSRSGLEITPEESDFRSLIRRTIPAGEFSDDKCLALQLMISVARAEGLGGLFLVDASPVSSGGVRLDPPWTLLGTLQGRLRSDGQSDAAMLGSLWRRAAYSIGKLAGADGAITLDRDLRVHAFGLHLPLATESLEFLETSVVAPDRPERKRTDSVSGTRQAAAIKYIHGREGAVALVVSQDGPVSMITKQAQDVIVTRRIELLLPTIDG